MDHRDETRTAIFTRNSKKVVDNDRIGFHLIILGTLKARKLKNDTNIQKGERESHDVLTALKESRVMNRSATALPLLAENLLPIRGI